MFEFIKQLLSGGNTRETSSSVDKKIQIATCALLLEIASADDDFSELEQDKVIEIMKKSFNLSTESVEELLDLAQNKMSDSVSIYEFTDIINSHFSREEKLEVLLNLWRLIYADNVLDKYEEHLVKKIGNNLKLEHRDIIEAKLTARDERLN